MKTEYVIDNSKESVEEVFMKLSDGSFIYLQKKKLDVDEDHKLLYLSNNHLARLVESGEFECNNLDFRRVLSSYVKNFSDKSRILVIDVPNYLLAGFKKEDEFELVLFEETEKIREHVLNRNIDYSNSLLKINEIARELMSLPHYKQVTNELVKLLGL